MKSIIDKISTYNIFNYLFPGILFAVISKSFTKYSFIQNDLVEGLFTYYFIGLVISRFGSLVVEPLLKKMKIVKYSSYEDFITACKVDDKLELLSEVNNMYRTIFSMFILLLLFKLYELFSNGFPDINNYTYCIALVLLSGLFMASYWKQTKFIKERVDISKRRDKNS